MNDAASVCAGITLIAALLILEPEALLTVRVTLYVPAVENAWLGFWAELVDPSLKFHCHEVGDPVDVSVNCTACPPAGEEGVKPKEAVRAATTVTVRVTLVEPEALVTVKVTVFDPAVV